MRQIKDLTQKLKLNYYKQEEHLHVAILNNTKRQFMVLIVMKLSRCGSLE